VWQTSWALACARAAAAAADLYASPLLSYRDPHTSKGELSPDEYEVTQTGLKEHFYRYLLDQPHDAQFIIIENDPPPFNLGPNAMVTTFVGSLGEGGRPGLL
jgi:hypothetical protein